MEEWKLDKQGASAHLGMDVQLIKRRRSIIDRMVFSDLRI
jgi:hypothetical protein